MDNGWVRDAMLIVVTYCVLGLGLGVAGYVGLSWVAGVAGVVDDAVTNVVFLQSVVAVFFAGPTVAALAGLAVGRVTEESTEAAWTAGIGTVVGFYPMVALAVVVLSTAIGATTGGSGGLTQYVGLLAFAAAPTGLVGAACGVLGTRVAPKRRPRFTGRALAE
ncbi:hypothetical protein [Halarchaeum sp. P4]|uniref:hypothetical protein n=1 Tax=Halarchaeum sp. P4 TaxID=3421639 RepID=UPI003EBDE14E